MKLLFDQNISFRILKKLSGNFSGSEQVQSLGLINKSDFEIWEFAEKNNFCIVTFDADFIDLSMLKGFPPKIIWLNTGNLNTDALTNLILSKESAINEFCSDNESGFLELTL